MERTQRHGLRLADVHKQRLPIECVGSGLAFPVISRSLLTQTDIRKPLTLRTDWPNRTGPRFGLLMCQAVRKRCRLHDISLTAVSTVFHMQVEEIWQKSFALMQPMSKIVTTDRLSDRLSSPLFRGMTAFAAKQKLRYLWRLFSTPVPGT